MIALYVKVFREFRVSRRYRPLATAISAAPFEKRARRAPTAAAWFVAHNLSPPVIRIQTGFIRVEVKLPASPYHRVGTLTR